MAGPQFGGTGGRPWSVRSMALPVAVAAIMAADILPTGGESPPTILVSPASAAETRLAAKKTKKRQSRRKKSAKRRQTPSASTATRRRVTARPRLRGTIPGASEARRMAEDRSPDAGKTADRGDAASGKPIGKSKKTEDPSAKPPGTRPNGPSASARPEKTAERKPKKGAPGQRRKRGIDLAVPAELLGTALLERLGKAFRRASGLRLRARAANPDRVNSLLKSGDLTAAILSRGANDSDPAGDAMAAFQPVFYVDLFVVGPKKDPADIGGMVSLPDGLKAIARSESTFLSAPLGHGINRLEWRVWKEIGVRPVAGRDGWYVATAAVAAKSTVDLLIDASRRQAYMIIDRAAWLASGLPGRRNRPLTILVRDDPRLQLVYGIVVRGSREDDPETATLKISGPAVRLRNWLAGKAAAKIINATVINGARPYLAERGLSR